MGYAIPAAGVGSLKQGPRTHPAHAEGRLRYNGADRDGQNGNPGWRVHMPTYTRFPYESFAAGQKDSWSKVGGPSEVFRFVKKGYMQDQFLKLARMKRQADIEEGLRRLRESRGEKGDLDDQRLRSVGLIK